MFILCTSATANPFLDTVVFIWLDEFCQNFGPNQPLTPAPEGFMLNFNKEVKTVEQVGEELRCLSPEESQRAFQGYLLNCLRDSQVGLYSYFHDNAIYRHGYDHANAVLMAYMYVSSSFLHLFVQFTLPQRKHSPRCRENGALSQERSVPGTSASVRP